MGQSRRRLIPTTSKVRKFASALQDGSSKSLKPSKLNESLGQEEVPPFEPDEVKIFLFNGIPKTPAEEWHIRQRG